MKFFFYEKKIFLPKKFLCKYIKSIKDNFLFGFDKSCRVARKKKYCKTFAKWTQETSNCRTKKKIS